MILLGFTVGAAFLPLGPFNAAAALAIAITKAVLVILFFMHVRPSPRLIWLYAAIGFFWLCHLLAGVFADVITRGNP